MFQVRPFINNTEQGTAMAVVASFGASEGGHVGTALSQKLGHLQALWLSK